MRDTIGFKILRAVVIVLLSLFVALPLFVMITSSIKPLQDVQGDFTWWPTRPTVSPFFDMWKTVPLGRYFVNSIIVSSAATVFSIIIAIFASFAVSRYRFRGRSAFTTTILSTQMFPGVLFLLPLFMIFVNIKSTFGIQLVGTRSGLVLMSLPFSLPFSIWMLSGYFNGIPRKNACHPPPPLARCRRHAVWQGRLQAPRVLRVPPPPLEAFEDAGEDEEVRITLAFDMRQWDVVDLQAGEYEVRVSIGEEAEAMLLFFNRPQGMEA